jgi:SSS family solute:Na+ symporter
MSSSAGTPLDYAIILAYLIGILAFGSFFGRWSRTTKEFFLAGQRFSWWLIAFSCISVVVGSYSFIKYSAVGFSYGLSATMTYTNDWFLAPLFVLGWLPIIYFARVTSIPEYFEKRFNRPTRVAALVIMLVYMLGYIGINFYTLGVALNALLGKGPLVLIGSQFTGDMASHELYQRLGGGVFGWSVVVALITGLYCTFGGQTAVIMTDLVQGILLLLAGLLLLFLGVRYVGGWSAFWNGLPPTHRLPFSGFSQPAEFPFVGIFWQDFFGSSMAFYFANQGLIMRFLAVKSVREGRKAIFVVVLFMMPLAAIAVASAGWVGQAMKTYGMIPADADPNKIFVIVSELVCKPGIFGLVMAALTAALMSTVDALINACAAIFVNDIYQPLIAPRRSDRHYLVLAKTSSMAVALIGIILVPVFAQYESIYVAHGTFTAATTPPLIVAVILAMLWKRYTPAAAFATLLGGAAAMVLSLIWPQVIWPFAVIHHMDPGTGYNYLRALYGVFACGLIGVTVTLFTRPKPDEEIIGLTIGTIPQGKRLFKAGEPNDRETGETILLELQAADTAQDKAILHPDDLARMKARPGDILYVAHRHWWWGGLRSLHVTAGEPAAKPGILKLSPAQIQGGKLRAGDQVRVEKIM